LVPFAPSRYLALQLDHDSADNKFLRSTKSPTMSYNITKYIGRSSPAALVNVAGHRTSFAAFPRVLVARAAHATYNEEKSCIILRLTNYVFDS
jgi:hypothetical protein